jgi:hypothetical protein
MRQVHNNAIGQWLLFSVLREIRLHVQIRHVPNMLIAHRFTVQQPIRRLSTLPHPGDKQAALRRNIQSP